MPEPATNWLTTGAVAKLCSVTPDTVQKWIKAGRLAAQRTAGGHYRIAVGDIQPFITCFENSHRWYAAPPRGCTPQPLRCWEYFAPSGEVRDCCKRCVVYRVPASWCFEVLGIAGLDHARAFCQSQSSCASCPYYRHVTGLPAVVLIVTDDQELVSKLEQGDNEPVDLHYARGSYDVAAAVGTLRPAFVVLDMDSSEAASILEHLASDTRVSEMGVILCGSFRFDLPSQYQRVIGLLHKPFDRSALSNALRSIPIERCPDGMLAGNEPEAGHDECTPAVRT